MSTAIATPLTDRAAWLAERQQYLGASEAAAALGLSPHESPRGLYLRKIGEMPEADESEVMLWGNLLEPVIADEFARRTGIKVTDRQVCLRGEFAGAPLGATLDGLLEDGRPLEIKTVSAWSGREIGDEGTDELPEHWLIQAHQQMHLADADSVVFAILIGGQKLLIRPVERNEQLIAAVLPKLGTFWQCVARRTPPPELHRGDREIMHLVYPGCSGEIDLTADDQAAVDRYQELGREIRDAEEIRKGYKASILESLKSNAVGYLPDGRIVTRKIVEVTEQVITRKGYTFVDMRVKKGVRS